MVHLLVKYVAPLLVVFTALFGSYMYGYSEANERAKIEQLEAMKEAKSREEILSNKLSEANKKLSEKEVQIQIVEKEVVRDVFKYIKVPYRSVCELDDDWVQLRQRILESADTRK